MQEKGCSGFVRHLGLIYTIPFSYENGMEMFSYGNCMEMFSYENGMEMFSYENGVEMFRMKTV